MASRHAEQSDVFFPFCKKFRCWKINETSSLSRLDGANTVAAVRTMKEKVIDVDAIDSSSI